MKLRNIFLLNLLLMATVTLSAGVKVTSLKTDYKVNPIGIDNPVPRLSWIIQSDQPNTMQESYEIRAALDPADLTKKKKLLWNSEKVASSQSVHVKYNGTPHKSYSRVYWQVRIVDNHGEKSKWSEVAFWEMGKLSGTIWEADWITSSWEEDVNNSMPSPYLRKKFKLGKAIKKARLYISAQGLYIVEINGKRVGNQEFTPGWTSYDTRVQYQVYDVSKQLKQQENAMGIILGDGWFRGFLGFRNQKNVYGTEVAAIAELLVEYTDGTTETILTDDSWRASTGPIIASDIYNGEKYDATKELHGWSSPGYDDSGWQKTRKADVSKTKLVAVEGPVVRVVNELEPLSIEKTGDGWLVDMGQNMVGWIRIKASGESGDVITLRHAEVLDKEGKMYYDNLRSADQINTFIMKGGSEELFEPHFTFQGFRFVMVSGYPGELTADRIRGMVIHSDMEPSGTFECSDSLINQLQHNIVWGLKGNFLDVPTDCPQRDERLGWTGDAQAFAPTACFNMNAASFYTKWLKDLAIDQGEDGMIPHVIPNIINGGGATGWADAGVVIPWVLYLEYGDITVLENQYASMKQWIGFMKEHAGEDLVWSEDWHFGDWLSFDDNKPSYMGASTTTDLIATAYYSYSSAIVAKVASVLGQEEDAKYYSELSEKVKEAFNREFVTPNGRLVAHTQTAYTLALAFNLLDKETAQKSAGYLAGDVEQFEHITTGFLGTPLISLTLTDVGRNDLAYKLLNRKEYPSWLYPVTMGATTIWERWDGQKPDSTFQTPGMNSFNHYAYGAIGQWLYQVVAGIGIDEQNPGYKHIIIKPRPGGGLTSARATHQSIYGQIASGWELEGEKLTMKVEIPVNTSATIHIPGDASTVEINGSALVDSGMDYKNVDGNTVVSTGSGNYIIVASLN
ncbi:MAG: glycoside hydrolase family 78 protein [Bacteroidales bacterium]|nr:glycoside hydrolase family 78 protein [Bacteroidales bacterium]